MISVKFQKPPLIEVVFVMEIDIPELSLVHFGLYWQTIKNDFPTPIETEYSSEISDFPAVWYLSSQKNRLIRLTNNYFSYHWRTVAEEYEHFGKLFNEFLNQWQNLETWWKSITNKKIEIKSYNLQYINIIDESSEWQQPEDNRKIFSFSDGNIKTSLNAPKAYSSKLVFNLSDNLGDLVVSLEQDQADDSNKNFLIFDLSASGLAIDGVSKEDWFISSHDAIIQSFLELTTKEAQSMWGKIDDEQQ